MAASSFVVAKSLPKAGMIFFAISSFCKHILAKVMIDKACKLKNILAF